MQHAYAAQYTVCTVYLLVIFNPIALRKAKIVYNFRLSECNRVNNIFFNSDKCPSLSFDESITNNRVFGQCFPYYCRAQDKRTYLVIIRDNIC